MKKLNMFLLLALFAVATQAQVVESEMTFEKKIHDFGIIAQDTCVVTCTFEFKNTGLGPLIIHQAATSCGCTVPEYTQEPIAPGATGTIKVTYNGKTKRPGVFKKSITIHSNAVNTPVRIYIQGEMTPSASFDEIMNSNGTESPVIQQTAEPEEKESVPVVEQVKPATKDATEVKESKDKQSKAKSTSRKKANSATKKQRK